MTNKSTEKSDQIKGNVLIARLRFVRERAGEPVLAMVLGRLPRHDQEVLRGILLPVSWYPCDLGLRLDDAIAQQLSPDDRSRIFVDMGRSSADTNLSGPHHNYVKEGDPHHLLSAAPKIYGLYHAIGRQTYAKTGEKSCVVRTYDAASPTPTDCLTVVGWYQRAIEMCGGESVVVRETQCLARGSNCCEYHCEWK